MTLGEFIKAYRDKNGLSQRQFADKSGVSNGYISMLEKNENPKTGQPLSPSMPVLKKIAAAMGMTVNDMCSFVDGMAIDLGTTVMDFEEAQEKLRIILSEDEYRMLRTYQGADGRAREDALAILKAHQK
jgi:transcriptional regulator with XRE-family HTH domain